jgi:hypothetical protein
MTAFKGVIYAILFVVTRLADRQHELHRLQQVGAEPPALVVPLGRRQVREKAVLMSIWPCIALCAVLLVCFVPAASASGVKPVPNACWGTCGGDSGPVGGYFTTTKTGAVATFSISEKCLGIVKGFEDHILIPVTLRVNDGSFAFTGMAQKWADGAIGPAPLQVSLKGKFVSSKEATVSITFKSGSCGTQAATIKTR